MPQPGHGPPPCVAASLDSSEVDAVCSGEVTVAGIAAVSPSDHADGAVVGTVVQFTAGYDELDGQGSLSRAVMRRDEHLLAGCFFCNRALDSIDQGLQQVRMGAQATWLECEQRQVFADVGHAS